MAKHDNTVLQRCQLVQTSRKEGMFNTDQVQALKAETTGFMM